MDCTASRMALIDQPPLWPPNEVRRRGRRFRNTGGVSWPWAALFVVLALGQLGMAFCHPELMPQLSWST